jgi:hypothetical protein
VHLVAQDESCCGDAADAPPRDHRPVTLAATDALPQGVIDVLTDDAGAPIAAAIWFDHTRQPERAPCPSV